MLKIKLHIRRIPMYFIILSFLFPRGFFVSYPLYKAFGTTLLYISLGIICMYWLISREKNMFKLNKHLIYPKIFCVLYFSTAIFITLIVQEGKLYGLQTLFATPLLCLYCFTALEKSPKDVIDVLTNSLLLLFILSLTIFNPAAMYSMTKATHTIFLGHIQVATQYGMLGILVGWLRINMFAEKKKAYILIICSVLLMLTSDSSSALLAVIIFVVVGIMYKWKIYKTFCKGTTIYVLIAVILGGVLFIQNIDLPIQLKMILNSRHVIWKEAYDAFIESPIWGYGIQGVTITTYWGGVMNYAHGQFVQNSIDGGIVLNILFYAMLFGCVNGIKKVQDPRVKVGANIVMCALLFFSLFDSLSFYPYYVIVFVLFAHLPFWEYIHPKK